MILQSLQSTAIYPATISGLTDENNFPPPVEKKKTVDKNNIPPGDYVLCVSVFSHVPKIELNRTCNLITVKNSIADSLLELGRSKISGLDFQVPRSVEVFSYIDVFTEENPVLYH